MTNTEGTLSASRLPRTIAEFEPILDLGCVGFPGACGAAVGSPCAWDCPSTATDEYSLVFPDEPFGLLA